MLEMQDLGPSLLNGPLHIEDGSVNSVVADITSDSTSSGPRNPAGIRIPRPSGYYFGDGSGGEYTTYTSPRRAGVGLHYVNEHKTPMYTIWQALLGITRTVDKAELHAVC